MNWKNEAINDLTTYKGRKQAAENIKERIKILGEQFVSLKSVTPNEKVMGGKSRREEKILDNISERQRLEMNLSIVESFIQLTEKGLSFLDKREKDVLEGFYFEQTDNHINTLCRRFNFEKSTLYRIKDEALRKFTIAMYGAVDI